MAQDPCYETELLVDQIVTMKSMIGRFAKLIEISLTLNTTLDQENILDQITRTAMEIMDCEAVSILLYDENSKQLKFAASSDAEAEKFTRIPVPIDDSIAGMVFTLNAPQVINNLAEDPRHFNLISEQLGIRHRSLIGVPMRQHDEVIGVLEGINKRDGKFNSEDVDILSVIASQAAVAINNARMMGSLQSAYKELSRIDQLKSEFIAIASHELRTPLFHILGYAELLEQDAEGESRENLQQVLRSARLLQSLVDDMTNMNLLEARAQQMVKVGVSVQQVLFDAYKEVKPAFDQKEVVVQLDLPAADVMVTADPEKLRQAFVNVLNNAARFTQQHGKVAVKARQKMDEVRITVRDNGIGIRPEKLESIFDRLVQADAHTTRSYGGMGLGLAIARGLIELHGGRIWAESEGAGRGSTFYMTVPVIKVKPFIDEI